MSEEEASAKKQRAVLTIEILDNYQPVHNFYYAAINANLVQEATLAARRGHQTILRRLPCR